MSDTFSIPIRARGTCPLCGSKNLHHTFTKEELVCELAVPRTMVLCRNCQPETFVLPIWERPEGTPAGPVALQVTYCNLPQSELAEEQVDFAVRELNAMLDRWSGK